MEASLNCSAALIQKLSREPASIALRQRKDGYGNRRLCLEYSIPQREHFFLPYSGSLRSAVTAETFEVSRGTPRSQGGSSEARRLRLRDSHYLSPVLPWAFHFFKHPLSFPRLLMPLPSTLPVSPLAASPRTVASPSVATPGVRFRSESSTTALCFQGKLYSDCASRSQTETATALGDRGADNTQGAPAQRPWPCAHPHKIQQRGGGSE